MRLEQLCIRTECGKVIVNVLRVDSGTLRTFAHLQGEQAQDASEERCLSIGVLPTLQELQV